MADEAPKDLQTSLAALDALQKKVLGAVITTMIGHHDQVRDQEWMAEQFTAAVALAMDLETPSSGPEGIAKVQDYAQTHIDDLLRVAFALFAQTARDMQTRGSFTYDDAVQQALSYF